MLKPTVFSKLIIVAALSLFVAACGDNDLEVSTQFNNTQDIKEGAQVYFQEQPIGEVVDTDNEGNGMSVVIELDPSAAEMVSSTAAVVVNRLKESAQLEIHNPNQLTTDFVQDGQKLTGLDSMFQLGAWMIGDAIQLGSETLSEYVGAFNNYLQSDKFQQDKTVVTEQVNKVAHEAQQLSFIHI